MRKPKIRWTALGTLAAKLGAIAGTVAYDPHIIATVTGKFGVLGVIALTVAQSFQKPITRKDEERGY